MSNQIDSRPICLVITSKTCPHCDTFKKNTWGSLKQKLLNDTKIKLQEIELPTNRSPLGNEYPSELSNYIGWFPTILLITASSWNNKKGLEVVVFNGIINNGVAILDPDVNKRKPLTENNIIMWISNILKSDPRFNSLPPSSPTQSLNQLTNKPTRPNYIITQNGQPIQTSSTIKYNDTNHNVNNAPTSTIPLKNNPIENNNPQGSTRFIRTIGSVKYRPRQF